MKTTYLKISGLNLIPELVVVVVIGVDVVVIGVNVVVMGVDVVVMGVNLVVIGVDVVVDTFVVDVWPKILDLNSSSSIDFSVLTFFLIQSKYWSTLVYTPGLSSLEPHSILPKETIPQTS